MCISASVTPAIIAAAAIIVDVSAAAFTADLPVTVTAAVDSSMVCYAEIVAAIKEAIETIWFSKSANTTLMMRQYSFLLSRRKLQLQILKRRYWSSVLNYLEAFPLSYLRRACSPDEYLSQPQDD